MPEDQNQLLHKALEYARNAGWPGDGYRFRPVSGGTQASVWQGCPDHVGGPEVAVRLTPKPARLISRIAALVDSIDAIPCPRTLAVTQLEEDGRTWTVHVCTWIGQGSAGREDPYCLGQHIARLHQQLAAGGEEFTDRSLSFERGPVPPAEQELPAWYIARHLWRDRIFPQFTELAGHMRLQPIHGDLHWDNVVAAGSGFGFIDFDKLMHAPRAFDLAKLIATGFFTIGRTGSRVRFRQGRAMDLLSGYRSVQHLSSAEVTAIEGFAVILNEQTAQLGHLFDNAAYREQADAVGGWWTRRRRHHRGNPLGIRQPASTATPSRDLGQQLALFPDDDLSGSHRSAATAAGRPPGEAGQPGRVRPAAVRPGRRRGAAARRAVPTAGSSAGRR